MTDDKITFKVFRGTDRDNPRYDTFTVPYDRNLSVTSMIQYIQRNPVDAQGKTVVPPQAEFRCQEKVCGSCAVMVNGVPHAGCHTFVRTLDTRTITVEPLEGFPVVADLVVNRDAMTELLIESKAFLPVFSTTPGAAATLPVSPEQSQNSYNAMDCMKCGVCIAACPNTSAALFLGAAHFQLNALPHGKLSAGDRAEALKGAAERKGFGFCSNYQACAAACPRGVPVTVIAELNRQTMTHLPRQTVQQ